MPPFSLRRAGGEGRTVYTVFALILRFGCSAAGRNKCAAVLYEKCPKTRTRSILYAKRRFALKVRGNRRFCVFFSY